MHQHLTRVLIADDQALVRAGFRMILESQQDIQVVGEAGDGEEAVAEWRRSRPNVILMDIRMPRTDGLEAARRILLQDTEGCRIIMLTTFDLDEYVYSALQLGASGFLLKDVTPEQLIAAVRLVTVGDALLAPSITRRLVERYAHPVTGRDVAQASLEELTPREHEVLALMSRGLNNAEIAGALVIGEATAKTHVARILSKLGVRDRVQAVVIAYQSGFAPAATPGAAGPAVSGAPTAGEPSAAQERLDRSL
jgi:DNA-binding NarL/FixJ family response regulator